jgi:hypothetical protein
MLVVSHVGEQNTKANTHRKGGKNGGERKKKEKYKREQHFTGHS